MLETKKILPVNSRALYIVLAAVLLITNCKAQTKVAVPSKNNRAIPAPTSTATKLDSKIKFSSVYSKLDSKTCQPVGKPASDEDKVPYFCDGYKDYKIYVSTHGIARFYVGREISENTDSWANLELPSFLFNAGFNQTIEWRLADGEPFACIVRAEYDKSIINPNEKGIANELVIKNLKGFAPISVSIDGSRNKRANEEARRAADNRYGKF